LKKGQGPSGDKESINRKLQELGEKAVDAREPARQKRRSCRDGLVGRAWKIAGRGSFSSITRRRRLVLNVRKGMINRRRQPEELEKKYGDNIQKGGGGRRGKAASGNHFEHGLKKGALASTGKIRNRAGGNDRHGKVRGGRGMGLSKIPARRYNL